MIATKNAGKVADFETILAPKGVKVKSLFDFPHLVPPEETGETFEENALIKAKGIASDLQTVVIADDSGLVIDALDGRPGVYSARYAGDDKDDQANIDRVLKEMNGVPEEERQAKFVSVLAVAFPDGRSEVFYGECPGVITRAPQGEHGFGYDPIFYVPEKGKTMAELPKEEKNTLSHRAKAMAKLGQAWERIEEGLEA